MNITARLVAHWKIGAPEIELEYPVRSPSWAAKKNQDMGKNPRLWGKKTWVFGGRLGKRCEAVTVHYLSSCLLKHLSSAYTDLTTVELF